jgi:hypothetical protein
MVYCNITNDDWLLGKDPFEVKIKIPEEVKNKSFVLPPDPNPNPEGAGEQDVIIDEYDTDK